MAFGSMGDHDDDAPMSEINVTPLVDVMLVLLIVFMITMPVLTHSIPIQLPTTSSEAKAKDEPTDPIYLLITEKGDYSLGVDENKSIDLDTLTAELKLAKEHNPDVVLAIKAHENVVYDSVVQALHSAKDAGVSKIGFVTEIQSTAQ